jgi:hypothetical protein
MHVISFAALTALPRPSSPTCTMLSATTLAQ